VNKQNILLLEDHAETADWINATLQEVFPGHLILLAKSIEEAEALLAQHQFELAILDISLPDGSGIDIIQQLKKNHPNTTCIMSTIFDDHKNIFSALQSGADGYIIKSDSREAFKNSLLCITRGEPPLSPAVARMLMGYFQHNKPVQTEHNLTKRQTEILTMIAKGMHSREVAEELGLSVHTIKDHVKNLYLKLSITSRTEAALAAQKLGFIK